MKYLSGLIMIVSMLVIGAGCCTNIHNVVPHDTIENERNVQIVRHIEDSTVALLIGPEDDKISYCAGVWVGEKRIITANHCAEVMGRLISATPEDVEYNAKGDVIVFANRSDLNQEGSFSKNSSWIGIIEEVDKLHDLASIMVLSPTSSHSIASLAKEEIRKGEDMHIIGHTVGFKWSYTRGFVSAIRNVQGPATGESVIKSKTLQVSAPIWVGNSGGGAFNINGNLVGICSWVTTKGPNVSFFIHKEEIEDFLRRIKRKN